MGKREEQGICRVTFQHVPSVTLGYQAEPRGGLFDRESVRNQAGQLARRQAQLAEEARDRAQWSRRPLVPFRGFHVELQR